MKMEMEGASTNAAATSGAIVCPRACRASSSGSAAYTAVAAVPAVGRAGRARSERLRPRSRFHLPPRPRKRPREGGANRPKIELPLPLPRPPHPPRGTRLKRGRAAAAPPRGTASSSQPPSLPAITRCALFHYFILYIKLLLPCTATPLSLWCSNHAFLPVWFFIYLFGLYLPLCIIQLFHLHVF
jgi:hypothetical protein